MYRERIARWIKARHNTIGMVSTIQRLHAVCEPSVSVTNPSPKRTTYSTWPNGVTSRLLGPSLSFAQSGDKEVMSVNKNRFAAELNTFRQEIYSMGGDQVTYIWQLTEAPNRCHGISL
jgi:hypothetical protein